MFDNNVEKRWQCRKITRRRSRPPLHWLVLEIFSTFLCSRSSQGQVVYENVNLCVYGCMNCIYIMYLCVWRVDHHYYYKIWISAWLYVWARLVKRERERNQAPPPWSADYEGGGGGGPGPYRSADCSPRSTEDCFGKFAPATPIDAAWAGKAS